MSPFLLHRWVRDARATQGLAPLTKRQALGVLWYGTQLWWHTLRMRLRMWFHLRRWRIEDE